MDILVISVPPVTLNSFALWQLPWCKKLWLRVRIFANVVQEKDRNIAELQNRIRILEEQMKLARQQRFRKKCESLAGMQDLFEEDVDADIAEISAHLDKLLPQAGDEEKTTTRPVRKPLPSHLPVLKRLSRQLRNVVLTVMPSCTSFAMKSANSISRHRSWSTAISARSTAVPAVKCSRKNAGTYPSEKCC